MLAENRVLDNNFSAPVLHDVQWAAILSFLKREPSAYIGRDENACRKFIEGVMWINATDQQWRDLPAEYGKWNTVYKRYIRWSETGVWDRMYDTFKTDPMMADCLIRPRSNRRHYGALSLN